jgi:hypothetical protein
MGRQTTQSWINLNCNEVLDVLEFVHNNHHFRTNGFVEFHWRNLGQGSSATDDSDSGDDSHE